MEGFRRLNTIKAHSDKTAYFHRLIIEAIFALSEQREAIQRNETRLANFRLVAGYAD
jgi:hypothetical protein